MCAVVPVCTREAANSNSRKKMNNRQLADTQRANDSAHPRCTMIHVVSVYDQKATVLITLMKNTWNVFIFGSIVRSRHFPLFHRIVSTFCTMWARCSKCRTDYRFVFFFFCCLSDFWAMCCHSAMSTGLIHVRWIRLKHWYEFYSNLSNVRVKYQRVSHVAWHRRRCQAMQSLCVGLIFCLFSLNSKLIASQNYKLNLCSFIDTTLFTDRLSLYSISKLYNCLC